MDVHHEIAAASVFHHEAHVLRRLETREEVDEERVARVGDDLEDVPLGEQRVDLVARDDVAILERFDREVLAGALVLAEEHLPEVAAPEHCDLAEVVEHDALLRARAARARPRWRPGGCRARGRVRRRRRRLLHGRSAAGRRRGRGRLWRRRRRVQRLRVHPARQVLLRVLVLDDRVQLRHLLLPGGRTGARFGSGRRRRRRGRAVIA